MIKQIPIVDIYAYLSATTAYRDNGMICRAIIICIVKMSNPKAIGHLNCFLNATNKISSNKGYVNNHTGNDSPTCEGNG